MNNHIDSIQYIRGLAMLGVIAIHTGSYALVGPLANIHLIALLEIASRFSVSIFFFVSAFSLFRQYPLDSAFDLSRFYKRRFSRVLWPYLVGSILYMLHYSWTTGDWSIWFPILVYQFFLFGMASYQLYFLVILLWFYLLMPLWRAWVARILDAPGLWLGSLFLAQIAFNYYSVNLLKSNFANFYLNLALEYRVSWWPFHYLFLFLLGGVLAIKYEASLSLLKRWQAWLSWLFAVSLVSLLAHYYFLLFAYDYPLIRAVNTVQQLSPLGVVYSVFASLYLLLRLDHPSSSSVRATLEPIGNHSYAIFWLHPLFLHYLHESLLALNLPMTVAVTIGLYLSTVLVSLAAAVGIAWLWSRPA